MSTLSVPDFKTSKDFVDWVESLDNKEIQSWKTKDWLTMYEKLTSLIDNDEKLKSEYIQHIKNLEKEIPPEKRLMRGLRKILNTPLTQIISKKQIGKDFPLIDSVNLRRYFTQQENNISAFIKLYNNYRFEPHQLKAIKELAKDNGKRISEEQDINLSEISGIMSDSVTHGDNMLKVANKVDKIVKENIDLPHERSSKVVISRTMSRGSGVERDIKSTPTIILGLAHRDSMLEIMFHEAAHAHLQNSSIYQQVMLARNNLPIEKYAEELNKDFYNLMNYNECFYLSPTTKDTFATSLILKNNSITSEELNDKLKKLQNGYKKQPNERYSYIFGIEAEREFRRQNKQNSERSALYMKKYLQPLLGDPVASKYVNGNIQIEYKSSTPMLGNKELIRRFNYLMEGADTELLKALNIHEEGKNVVLTIPTEYSFREKIVKLWRANHSKNNLIAYSRNKLAQKIDKTAASLGIDSNLQDYKMSESYKNKELKMSRKLEKINRVNDYSRKKNTHDLQKVAGIIKDGLKSARQFIKNKLSKDR